MIDFVHMDLVPGEKPLAIEEGQTVLVDFEGTQLAMEVLLFILMERSMGR